MRFSRLRRWWFAADKPFMAALLLVGAVLGALGLGLQAHFSNQEARREAVHAAERESLDCLARNVYFEARGEPLAGMRAVAEVTLNRAASRRYPDSICAVVYQRNWDPIRGRHVGAFSWTEFDALPPPAGAAWEQAQQVAQSVYYRRVPAALPGVLHFHATHIKPEWAKDMRQVARIGRHVFYR